MPKQTIASDTIECPQCGEEIVITAALQRQLMAPLREELAEREKALERQEAQLATAKSDIDKAVAEQVEQAIGQVEQEARKKAEAARALEFEDMQGQLEEARRKSAQLEKNELALRKDKQELEHRQQTLELEVLRQVDAEKRKIEDETAKRVTEAHRLKMGEKEKVIRDLQHQLEDARRTAEQGSQQTQGEVLELELEAFLKQSFPLDVVEPVAKGKPGADVLQQVYTNTGHPCGTIIWESKRTKSWSEGWLEKLKEDQRNAKAGVAVLVTEALPKGVQHFVQREGVWVTSYPCVFGLASALRQTLLQGTQMKLAAGSKDAAMDAVFHFLTGSEFRNRVEALVESFITLKQQLDHEKRATVKRWAQTEKHLERITLHTAGMYGDFQGLLGASMQSIPALEAGVDAASEIEAETAAMSPEG
jgi:hypothetical protein